MDAKEKYQQGVENFVATTNFKQPKNVPIIGAILTWPVGYYKMNLNEMLQKPKELAEKFCNIFDEVYFDVAHICGISTSIRSLEALGSDTFFISEDGSTIQHEERCYMQAEDYDALIANPRDFMLNVLGARKLEKLRAGDDTSYAALVQAAKEMIIFNQINPTIAKIMADKYGIAPVFGKSKVYPPFDYIFDRLRGFAGTMTDVRRHRAKLLEATNAMYEYVKGWTGKENTSTWTFSGSSDPMSGFPYAISTLHCPTFMRPKDYEELYFPTFKMLIETVYNSGSKTVLFNEGSWIKFNDIMKQLPKGATVSMLDDDDPIEMKKAMGEYTTVCGGVTLAKMRCLSKQECIDDAKKILDACAPGGGFAFSTDKSLCGPNDVKIENYAAVNDFVHNYS